MYGRRRPAVVLPASRRHEDTRSTNAIGLFQCSDVNGLDTEGSNCTVNNARPVTISFVTSSSSSSSSRSSSPISTMIGHSSRRSNRIRRSNQLETRSIITSRSGDRRGRTTLRLDVNDSMINPNLFDSPNQSSSSSVTRCAIPANSKSATRTRRRAFLRSPIFQLILSPNSNPCHNTSISNNSGTTAHHMEPRYSNLDFSVQITHTGGTNSGQIAPERPRTTRSGSRVTRASSQSRRTSSSNTRPSSTINLTSSQLNQPNDMRRSQNSLANLDVRTALVVARTTNPEGGDDCVICLCEKSNRSVLLPCMHTFCFDCIYRWLCINPSCPLCKRLAQRIIHSVLSDTEFTEVLVSDLPRDTHQSSDLTGSFDLDESYLRAAPEDTTMNSRLRGYFPQYSEHVDFLSFLGNVSRGPPRGRLFSTYPILMRSAAETVPSNVVSEPAPHRITYRWNNGTDSHVETRRSLLTYLINNALRPRDSSLLDSLLLRQVVYVFCFDSVPVSQNVDLIRDISPEFLASNETHRHRLQQFIRRELRVLAPWLAYTIEQEADSDHWNVVGNLTNAPITAPLITGAPGPEANTRELDDITTTIVRHFCSVPITDEQALVNLLSNHPAFHSLLVPRVYLHLFASEVLQFAQFNGTLEEYDAAVCLYRRRITFGGLPTSVDRTRWRQSQRSTPDPRLAVYVASACWPRLRPGFAQPQGLITHPLANWLLQRLFVHAFSGPSHPSQLPGTGEIPQTVPVQFVYTSSSVLCHPNCQRLASSARALLEALPPSFSRLRNRNSSRTHFLTSQNNGAMTNAELFPNRLLFQRILSELIDQARFSEALSASFSQSNNQTRDQQPTRNLDEPLISIEHLNQTNDFTQVTSTSLSANDLFDLYQPAHLSALRRLDGLLLLFTARIPGLTSEPDNFISELLHMPLMPMLLSPSPPVIDLTNTRPIPNRSQTFYSSLEHQDPTFNVTNSSEQLCRDRFTGIDWLFLSPSHTFNAESLDVLTGRNDAYPIPNGNFHTAQQQSHEVNDVNNFQSSLSHPVSVPYGSNDTSARSPEHLTRSSENDWRSASPCVVISSDSSSDEETAASSTLACRSNVLTSDESDQGHTLSSVSNNVSRCANMPLMAYVNGHSRSVRSSPVNSHCDHPAAHSDLSHYIRKSAAQLSLIPSAIQSEAIDSSSNNLKRHEEPMEVDEVSEVTHCLNFQERLTNALLDCCIPLNNTDCNEVTNSNRNFSTTSLNRSSSHDCYRSSLGDDSFSSNQKNVGLDTISINSPINIVISDSDCELVRESIHVKSDSSNSSSRSSSTDSSSHESSLSSRIANPVRSRSVSRRRKCLKRRRKSSYSSHKWHSPSYTSRHSYHRSKYHCCCSCHVKHSCKLSRTSVPLSDRKRYQLLDDSPALNLPSSPIVISDVDQNDEVKESQASPFDITSTIVPDSLLCENSPHPTNQENQVSQLQVAESCGEVTDVRFSLPVCSSSSNMVPEISISKCSTQSPSKSLCVQTSYTTVEPIIYDPPTVTDFYRFLTRFNSESELIPLASTSTSNSDTSQLSACTDLPQIQTSSSTEHNSLRETYEQTEVPLLETCSSTKSIHSPSSDSSSSTTS